MDPEKILLLTFTRRAAQEMIKRASSMLTAGSGACSRIWGGTFHATANRLLRMYGRAAGISDDFTMLDQGDAEDLMNVVRHDLGMDSRGKRFPKKTTCLAIYSRCSSGNEPIETILQRFFPWCTEWQEEMQKLFGEYVVRKQKLNVLDFDDLLLYWNQCLTDANLSESMGGRFDHILVDEYQDTNPIQASILRGMRRIKPDITAVGDDAQSIYSFRAATVRNILDFPTHFPGTTVVTLEQNYRSTRKILASTNSLIAKARERYVKNLWSSRPEGNRPKLVTCRDESDQDRYVVEQILSHYEAGVSLRQQAVLFRAADLSDSLELELTRRNIPYHKYGGLRFLETAHIKDVLAFLRILENPRDQIAWFRVLLLFPGIGPVTASRVYGAVAASRKPVEALRAFDADSSTAESLNAVAVLFEQVGAGSHGPSTDVELVRRIYDPLLREIHEAAEIRSRDIEHLQQIAGAYKSRGSFLTDLQLDPPMSTGDLAGPPLRDEDWLVLSTIHSAKGCEWDSVYLIHASDGCLPSDMATGNAEEIEEELRLAYVAMTRAKNDLHVTWPLRYYHRPHTVTDHHSYAQLSRFFDGGIQSTFDTVVSAAAASSETIVTAAAHLDIAQRMRERWK